MTDLPLPTSVLPDPEVDEYGFPRSLPFWAENNTVTRTITITAGELQKDDLLTPPVGYRRIVGEPRRTQMGDVALTVRFIDGSTTEETYAATRPVTVERTKTYTARMPDQRSVSDQLRDLAAVARRMGMYDAEDYLRGVLAW